MIASQLKSIQYPLTSRQKELRRLWEIVRRNSVLAKGQLSAGSFLGRCHTVHWVKAHKKETSSVCGLCHDRPMGLCIRTLLLDRFQGLPGFHGWREGTDRNCFDTNLDNLCLWILQGPIPASIMGAASQSNRLKSWCFLDSSEMLYLFTHKVEDPKRLGSTVLPASRSTDVPALAPPECAEKKTGIGETRSQAHEPSPVGSQLLRRYAPLLNLSTQSIPQHLLPFFMQVCDRTLASHRPMLPIASLRAGFPSLSLSLFLCVVVSSSEGIPTVARFHSHRQSFLFFFPQASLWVAESCLCNLIKLISTPAPN